MNEGTYQIVEELQHYEFGFLMMKEQVEIIAIDHSSSLIRTLGYSRKVEDAEFILETCIRFGFKEKGMNFEGLPGYELVKHPLAMEV